ncbi:uncharacterized protein KY384_002141 [Bacidia gigantensis]|uniref:uncharacterized protein n=1 Tax=Bacidia gigantensis TaxID=2732470 RepID=UPI001D0488C4|nr:uncharacterized protein KY384_002141 [Bacidia gigantensis]KAG8533358.1 hypothetical protein KY384_002141 [Bacidia gigantensis]
MPRTASNTTQSTYSKAARARQYLKGGGIARDDSDDELGLEDHPWEWIYSHSPAATPQKQRHRNEKPSKPALQIIGARMGKFECHVGDCVLLKAEGNNEAWVGLICDFIEDDEDESEAGDESDSGYESGKGRGMAAEFMWFSTAKEIRNEKKRRSDALANEVYIAPSWDRNPLASINGKAVVLSQERFLERHPNGKVPRGSKDLGKIFVCRRGCNTRTATYTEEFNWENVYKGAGDMLALIELVRNQTKATRKKRKRGEDYEEDAAEEVRTSPYLFFGQCSLSQYTYKPDTTEPRTPSKKRKQTHLLTPSSTPRRRPKTPNSSAHKRITLKKPLTITPLTTRFLSPTHTNSTPHQLARSSLHVSSVPATLPCRETEFATVYSHLETAITAGSGSCIYISGTPGTGKTATVREVIASLHGAVQADELDDFIFVEINGMKVTEPTQAYSLLWEALRDERVSPTHALGLLEQEFSRPSPRRVPCVVLMDELDQLVTRTQSVMYNFFNWPGLRHSRLIVLAVANTMDLPERMLSNKISSRLGLTRILFPGYSHEQLMEIVRSRLAEVGGDGGGQVVDEDAVQFAARKVAAVSGDARRCLDICRRAVEIAEVEGLEDGVAVGTPSKSAKRKERVETNRKSKGTVTIQTVKAAINEATSSPLQQYLKSLPLAAKTFLAALLARARKTGVNECVLVDVVEEARRLALMAVENPKIQEVLMKDKMSSQPKSDQDNFRRKAETPKTSYRVKGLSQAAAELAEAGVIGLEGGRVRGERIGKVRLAIGDEEISTALRGDVEVRGLGFG